MPTPVEALQRTRSDLVESRRDRILRSQPIADLQLEIEAVDRALADEKAMLQAARSKAHLEALTKVSQSDYTRPSDADMA